MKDIVIPLLINNALWAFVQYMITRHDKKVEDKDGIKSAIKEIKQKFEEFEHEIKSKFKKQEKDAVRTQLLVLMLLRPDEKQEILTLSEHYFEHLKGNWYMTSIFNKWLTETDTAKPEWFNN